MTVRRRTLGQSGQCALAQALLKRLSHDFFGDIDRHGGLEAARAVWEARRDELLAEFARLHGKDSKPLGWHLFDAR